MPGLIAPLLIAVVIVAAGCDSDVRRELPASKNATKSVVVVTSYPLFAVASELAGDDFEVCFPAADHDNPREWKPAAADVQQMQSADLVLLNGAGYEPWLMRVTLPRSRLCDTTQGLTGQLLSTASHVSHQHGPDGGASHQTLISTTWLSPHLLMSQAQQISQNLQRLRPVAAQAVAARETAFTMHLQSLVDRLENLAKSPGAGAPAERLQIVLHDHSFRYVVDGIDADIVTVGSSADEVRATLAGFPDGERPKLIVCREASLATLQPVADAFEISIVALDLCEAAVEGASLAKRLESNVTKLEAALNRG